MAINRIILICLVLILLSSCSKKIASRLHVDFPENIENIKIHEATTFVGPCEPSISINPINTNNIVAGSVLDNVYTSNDGGNTWTLDILKSTFGVYGDPVVRHNNDGSVLYAHLSNPSGKAYKSKDFLDRIVIHHSSDEGKTWNNGVYPPADQSKDHDKHWINTSPNTAEVIMTWTEFDKYASKDTLDKSKIMFSKSTDYGLTWSKAKVISQFEGDCIDSDDTTEGAVPAIGTDGSYMVSWSYDEKIYFDRSMDKGATWLKNDIIIADQPGGWDFSVEGIGRCNGMPITEVDHSNGPHRGNVYVNWSDQRNGEKNTDIWFIKSSDNGTSWTDPIKVNDDESRKQQFFTWMDVDPVTGFIYIVFYDRRNYEDDNTDVYLAYSTDGGNTFTNRKISTEPFKANKSIFFGDYNDISAFNGKIRPIWTRLDGYKLSVMTALIDINVGLAEK